MAVFSKKKKKTEESDQMSLQITSMADIFTIILVFLLKSFATSSISLAPGVQLPHVNHPDQKAYDESLTIEIQENQILCDQKPVMPLTRFFAQPRAGQVISQPDALETQITPFLKEALQTSLSSEQASSGRDHSKITILADHEVPYVTLQEVMRVASVMGFKVCQLIMVREE
jgi:biopolymer transport protein ExbD